jgi:hypothetical protein
MEKIQDIELTIKDLQKDGVFAISLVENPAIEEDFIYLNSHQIELKVVDEEKRIVVGYALIPDKKIYRNVNGKKFNIYFSADTVRQSAELYMANLKQNSVTVNHEKKIEGAGVIESWITEDEKHDKINLYGVKPIVGGWVVMMKINNDEEWQAVKRGEYKGFSIEARYDGFEQLKQNKMENVKEELKKIIQKGLELESQNVELGMFKSVAEIRTMYAEVKTIREKITAHKSALGKIQLQLLADAKSLGIQSNNFITEVAKTITEAKALGLEVPKDVLNLQSFIKEYVKVSASANKLASLINSNSASI